IRAASKLRWRCHVLGPSEVVPLERRDGFHISYACFDIGGTDARAAARIFPAAILGAPAGESSRYSAGCPGKRGRTAAASPQPSTRGSAVRGSAVNQPRTGRGPERNVRFQKAG